MRHHVFIFWLIRIPLELFIVVGAFFLAREIRLQTDLIPGIQLPVRDIYTSYLLWIGVASYVVISLIFSFQKLYTIDANSGILEEIFIITKSLFVSFFIIVWLIYLSNGFPYDTILIPRLIIIYAFLISLIGIIFERSIIRLIRYYGFQKNWLKKKNILLIMNHSEPFLEWLFTYENHLKVAWYLSPFVQSSTFKYLGTISTHKEIIESLDIEEVIILNHDLPYEIRKTLFEYCCINGIIYRYVGNLYETGKNNAHIDFIGGLPLIEIRSMGITAWGRVVKRVFDIVVWIGLVILLLPSFLIIMLGILIETTGFPLYISHRVGRNGRLFPMFKFRSMVQDAEKLKNLMSNERIDGPLFKVQNDPRITKFGKWIRRWSIDELPQIINVIRGDMSFIWPRPHLPLEVEKYSEKQKQVLIVKPGITGMAQVHGRDRNSFEKEIELDLFYIENWSLLLDTKIFLLTFRAVFQGR